MAELPPLSPTLAPPSDLPPLPPINPRFHVPPLPLTPHDPIKDGLGLPPIYRLDTTGFAAKESMLPRTHNAPLPLELAVIAEDYANFWNDASKAGRTATSRLASWDGLRSSFNCGVSLSPFLSEQPDLVLAAARYNLNPPLNAATYVSPRGISDALQTTVLGLASLLHSWDVTTERFVPTSHGSLRIDGMDEVVSRSIVARFTNIGALIRRLDVYTSSLRAAMSPPHAPTIHAFASSLSSLIAHTRSVISFHAVKDPSSLLTFWASHADMEECLVALSQLVHRGPESHPPYTALPFAPVPLLSRLHHALESAFECSAPRSICARLAWIFLCTSRPYLDDVCASVGCGPTARLNLHSGTLGRDNRGIPSLDGVEAENDDTDDDIDSNEGLMQDGLEFPSFFPQPLQRLLPAARRSLDLLRMAQPEAPLLHDNSHKGRSITWVWQEDAVHDAWVHASFPRDEFMKSDTEPPPPCLELDLPAPPSLPSSLSSLEIFSLPPSSQIPSQAQLSPDAFLASFPERLPFSHPTLSSISSLALSPLHAHAAALSNAALTAILPDARREIRLLRAHMMVVAPGFRARLQKALFSDADFNDGGFDGWGNRMWAVGLAYKGPTWPPGGAELAFLLRTVIMDSIDATSLYRQGKDADIERLGFAIRDLEVDNSGGGWENPFSLGALDFLYMEYRPPRTLRSLITRDVIAKYQRIFALSLRLMRVEAAISSVFRMARHTVAPLFPTLARSREKLFIFRFAAHEFAGALSYHVADTAVRGIFDPFLERLEAFSTSLGTLGTTDDGAVNEGDADEANILSISQLHSKTLDTVLSACLLRSGQRAARDVMLRALQNVLSFALLVGELHRGRLKEYEASGKLDDLWDEFRRNVRTLGKVSKALVDRSGAAISSEAVERGRKSGRDGIREPMTGYEALHHLLLRLDLGQWWSPS